MTRSQCLAHHKCRNEPSAKTEIKTEVKRAEAKKDAIVFKKASLSSSAIPHAIMPTKGEAGDNPRIHNNNNHNGTYMATVTRLEEEVLYSRVEDN